MKRRENNKREDQDYFGCFNSYFATNGASISFDLQTSQ